MEKLYDIWARRNPQWELRFKDPIIERFTNYKTGSGESAERRGKIFGGGYEIFILAFFLGLYANLKRPLPSDPTLKHDFGQPIEYWGNVGTKGRSTGRVDYGALRDYMFAALIAKTEIDFIALDKKEISPRKAVDELIKTMEEYANYGFQLILDKTQTEPDFFLQDGAFFELFQAIRQPESVSIAEQGGSEDLEPSPL